MADDRLTLAQLGARVGRGDNPNAAGPRNLLRTLGSYLAPELTSYFTEPETPYSRRLEAAGGAIGPQGHGAPKLELQAQQIGRRAQETGKSPEQVRDEGLQGLEHWLVPLVGGPTAAALLGRSSEPTTY